jgi:hypothetical protein
MRDLFCALGKIMNPVNTGFLLKLTYELLLFDNTNVIDAGI